MILTLTASIMYWSLQQRARRGAGGPGSNPSEDTPADGDDGNVPTGDGSNIDDATTDPTASAQVDIEAEGNRTTDKE